MVLPPDDWDPVDEQRALGQLKRSLFGAATRHVRVARYRLVRRVGEGGNGVVYEGFDPDLDRRVAVKLVRVRQGGARTLDRARLIREARALAKLAHPNIVAVYDVGSFDPTEPTLELPDADARGVYLVTEFIDGQTLHEWLLTPRTWREVLDVFIPAAEALDAAHREGLVHRDFKPANAMLSDDGRVRVLDFGLAREPTETTAPSAAEHDTLPPSSGDKLTETGLVLGTPAYMAPEQRIRSAQVDARADQYAFCVTLHEALFGFRPTVGALPGPVPDTTSGVPVPPALFRLVQRGLQRFAADRFDSMDVLIRSLRRIRRDRTARWPFAALAGVIATACATWFSVRTPPRPPCAVPPPSSPWSEETSQELEVAFAATGLPFARASSATVREHLDQWATQWTTVADGLCERPEALARPIAQCLRRRAASVEGARRRWERPTPAEVRSAVEVAHSLSSPLTCERQSSARERSSIEEAIEAELADLSALRAAGDYDAGLTRARALHLTVRDMGDAELAATAARILAEFEQQVGSADVAAARLTEAYWWAVQGGFDEEASQDAILLVEVYGSQFGQRDEGLRWAREARARVDRTRNPLALAELSLALASLYDAAREYDTAHGHARDAVRQFENVVGTTDPRYANALNALGGAQRSLGDPEGARRTLLRALAVFESVYGREHPVVAQVMGNLASAEADLGNRDRALELHREEYDLLVTGFGPEHIATATALSNLSATLPHDRWEEALRGYATVRAIYAKAYGADHVEVGVIRYNEGTILALHEQWDRAEVAFEDCVRVWTASYGSGSPMLGLPLLQLAAVHEGQGRLDAARSAARRGRALCEQRDAPAVCVELLATPSTASDDSGAPPPDAG